MSRPTRIALVTDIHLRTPYRECIEAVLESTVEEIRRFDPDLVVCLGDSIEDETERRDETHLRAVRERLAFEAPVRMLAGNHDVANLDRGRLASLFGNELAGLERCREEPLLFLNTATPRLGDPRGEVSTDQFERIDRAMGLDDPVTVFVHHPIHFRDLSDTVWWSETPEQAFCGNKEAVCAALEADSVRCVFNGHLHDTDRTRYRGIDHVTVNAFSKETPDLPVTGTYATVELGKTVDVDIRVGETSIRQYSIG